MAHTDIYAGMRATLPAHDVQDPAHPFHPEQPSPTWLATNIKVLLNEGEESVKGATYCFALARQAELKRRRQNGLPAPDTDTDGPYMCAYNAVARNNSTSGDAPTSMFRADVLVDLMDAMESASPDAVKEANWRALRSIHGSRCRHLLHKPRQAAIQEAKQWLDMTPVTDTGLLKNLMVLLFGRFLHS